MTIRHASTHPHAYLCSHKNVSGLVGTSTRTDYEEKALGWVSASRFAHLLLGTVEQRHHYTHLLEVCVYVCY